MRWRKLGHIFCGAGEFPWMASHAGVPFAEHIDGDFYRIYFTCRDAHNRSHVGWVEIDINRPDRILRLSEEPILSPGEAGNFDDAGTTLSCVVRHGERRHFYYIGWSLRLSVPYHLAIGLAFASGDTGAPTLSRLSGPIIDRNRIDPLFCTAPFVMVEDGRWRVWYVSGLGWVNAGGEVVPSYNTRYAESNDGVDWNRTGLVVRDPQGDELGFSRPSILFEGGAYHMWCSVRGRNQPYRLDHARSQDGLAWTRNDDGAGPEASASGWDSEMIAYPHVFNHRGDRYMLYCGNGYGKTGFGIAVLT
jgi:hypothetical protein